MRSISALLLVLVLAGCSMMGTKQEPIPTVPSVDLARFMGDWYVISAIGIGPEKKAHNAIETYKLVADGSIETTYRMRKGFDEPLKVYHPTGYVRENTGNALWGMQFIWPFKGEYRIAFVEPDYSASIIARNKRDYVWLLARTPSISDAAYKGYVKRIAAMGYDTSKLRLVPQKWPETAAK